MERAGQLFSGAALLLVEDEVEAREMLGRMLSLNYPEAKIYQADDGVAGLEMYREFRPEVVITDLNMPHMNGIAMAREIKAIDRDATIVAVTAHSETSYLLNAIEIGIDHYLLKPVNYPELFRIMERVGEKIKLRRMEQLMMHQAQHDTLTDLPNRKLFMDFLTLELAQARRNRKSLAVLFLDLDHFKQINDTLGHAAGDELLQAVARRLKGCVRESDTVARIGGDEFNVLMPDLSQTDDVGVVVHKIMGVFEAPFRLEGVEVKATTSVGVSMYPEDGDSTEDLLKKADAAMYAAKQYEGSSYQFYNDEINARTVSRQELLLHLRVAANKGEFELLYQPLFSMGTRSICGAEALLRWRHPQEGVLLPAQFLSVAEETGVIIPIGAWVIDRACRQARRWRDLGLDLKLAVNLTSRELQQPGLPDLVLRGLSENGVSPSSLELDVPERAIMDGGSHGQKNMHRLTELGVAFAVDDFGTGASSLQRIRRLPIAKLKIDRSFIGNTMIEPEALDVVTAVVCMSHSMKLRVSAVGVESPEQLALLESRGCDEVQGDFIGKPLTAAEFERLFAPAAS